MRSQPEDVRAVRSEERVSHWAGECPDKLAIGYAGDWITYAEWHERAQRLAESLRGDASPVALVYDVMDAIDFAVGYVAAHAAGRPALVLNPRIPGADLRAQIERAGAGVVLSSVGKDVEPATVPRLELLRDRWGFPIAEVSFSSGTTGQPKGIMLSHWSLSWAGVMCSQLVYAGRHSFDAPGRPLDGDDTIVSAFQAGSAATTNGVLNAGLDVGARMHFLPKFDATTFTDFMRSVDASAFMGAPAHIALWRQGDPDAIPSARVYVVIGQAPSGADVDWFMERRGEAHLVNAYGLTESGAGLVVSVDEEIAAGAGMIGKRTEGVEIRLIGPDGEESETEGELVMRSFGMMEGYLDRPDLTDEKVREGWLHTGDIVARQGERYLIRGRVGDRINRGGYKFDPIDVENVAAAVPGVTGAVACAIPHPVLGEDVALAIEVAGERDVDAIRQALSAALVGELPSFKVPRQIRVVRELPRGGLSKPQRSVVSGWFAEAEHEERV